VNWSHCNEFSDTTEAGNFWARRVTASEGLHSIELVYFFAG
jgi:hypothetical protein